MPVYMAKTGESYVVKRVGGQEEIKHHLNNLGFVSGSQISVVAFVNGSLIVQVKDSRIAISRELAAKILI